MSKKCLATLGLTLVLCSFVTLSCRWALSWPTFDQQGAKPSSPGNPTALNTYTPDLNASQAPSTTITPDPEAGIPPRIREELRKHTPPPGFTPTTGLTEMEEARAIEVVLKDDRVQALLAGKTYEVAPRDDKWGLRKIGPWTTKEGKKLGVSLLILFDKPYFVDTDLPYDEWNDPNYTTYASNTYHYATTPTNARVSEAWNAETVPTPIAIGSGDSAYNYDFENDQSTAQSNSEKGLFLWPVRHPPIEPCPCALYNTDASTMGNSG